MIIYWCSHTRKLIGDGENANSFSDLTKYWNLRWKHYFKFWIVLLYFDTSEEWSVKIIIRNEGKLAEISHCNIVNATLSTGSHQTNRWRIKLSLPCNCKMTHDTSKKRNPKNFLFLISDIVKLLSEKKIPISPRN